MALCKKMLIHPNNQLLANWNVFISLLLVLSCMTTPLHLAYFDESSWFYNPNNINGPKFWEYFNNIVDLLFLADIIITFNTALHDQDFMLIQDRGKIAK